jgi:hypothetical protein
VNFQHYLPFYSCKSPTALESVFICLCQPVLLDRIDSEFCKLGCILFPHNQNIDVFGLKLEADDFVINDIFTFINEHFFCKVT